MIDHEYEVRFSLETTSILTIVYVGEEDEDRAILRAEQQLGYDGIDLSKLDIIEVIATKTGELH